MSVWGEGDEPDVHALAGAYALDAVDDVERQHFERHLRVCDPCREEVRTFHATAAALGASEAEVPPARLRTSVLEAAARTRQERPEPVRDLPRSRSLQRLLPVAAAVLLVASLALGGALAVNRNRLGDAERQATRLEQTLDRLTVSSTVALTGGGQLRLRRGEGAAVVELVDAPAPAGGRTYQLWLLSPEGEAAPAGLIPDPGARAYVEELGDATALAVTEEPRAGSLQPTTEPLGVLPLASAR
jgi:anti-sigma-K factor RskA